jgi:hypothetical protein
MIEARKPGTAAAASQGLQGLKDLGLGLVQRQAFGGERF